MGLRKGHMYDIACLANMKNIMNEINFFQK